MIEIPLYEPDPEALAIQELADELLMRRYHEAVAANEAALERRREGDSIHALLMIAQYGTRQELSAAMRQAFGPGRLR
jgi:hypothetical protein